MKIIDILNKIANGEEPPKKIYYRDGIFEYDEKEKDYKCSNGCVCLFDYYVISTILNDEVEILETTIDYVQDTETIKAILVDDAPIEQDKIEKLSDIDGIYNETHYCFKNITRKINEIIDRLNND